MQILVRFLQSFEAYLLSVREVPFVLEQKPPGVLGGHVDRRAFDYLSTAEYRAAHPAAAF